MGEYKEELGYDNFSKPKIIRFILCPRVGCPKAGGANGYSKRHYQKQNIRVYTADCINHSWPLSSKAVHLTYFYVGESL
jgi:hypothetical protein